jgi:hypothetical protein
MLIEDLIRLGRPVLESGLEAREILRLITDAADDRVKNFYRHVIVVELPPEGTEGEPAVLRVQKWQVEQQVVGKKPEIDVDVERALGAPFVIPSGGSVKHAQGRYGVPVYPMWNLHYLLFRESADGIRGFLEGRLTKTSGFTINEAVLIDVSVRLHQMMTELPFDPRENWLGVLVLARCGKGDSYSLENSESLQAIAQSALYPGRFIRPNDQKVLEGYWAAKIEEGAEFGRRDGPCTITGEGDSAVSAYCKAWPWALIEWTCPIPHGGGSRGLLKTKETLLAGIALSEASYRALTLGANLFHGLTRKLHHVVLPELFAPVENRDRQNAARNRRLGDLTTILGSAFLLPLRDTTLSDPADRDEFACRIVAMLNAPLPPEPMADGYLTDVIGFDMMLPEELNRDEFRLTLVYFSSGGKAADVHLRAYIQDVLPSTAGRLKKLVRPCREQMTELLRLLLPNASEGRRNYLNPRYQSVPYLLGRGYGGSHLWTVLEQCLHRRPLDSRPVLAHVAARIGSVVPGWPDSWSDVLDEVIFLLVCRDFIHRYNREVAHPPKEDPMPMRPWQDLIRAYERDPIEQMEFTVAELGFASGLVLHRFNGFYTYSQGRDKDFLKHRVLTFGADLGPRDVVRAVGAIRTVAAKFDDLRGMVETGQLAYYPEEERKRHTGDFQRRLGVVLNALERFRNDLDKGRDEFMTGFWSGYCLQGYDRPRKPKTEEAKQGGGEQ